MSVLALDTLNPQIAARLVTALQRLAPPRTGYARTSCAGSSKSSPTAPALSPDVAEIVARALL